MSLVQKTNPEGVDIEIDQIQDSIYSYLTNNAGWTVYESYPRAYKNERDGGTIPEIYDGSNEYKECFLDDKFNVTSFFLTSDTRPFDGANKRFDQVVSIIFQADIRKLYPAVAHRADEEMHNDIYSAIKSSGKATYISSVVTSVSEVYSALRIPAGYETRIGFDDMSNYHVVKVDLTIPFNYCN